MPAKRTATPRKKAKRSGSKRQPGAASTETRLRHAIETLDETINAPLGAELPVDPDAPLAAVDPDALEVLNDTQTIADTSDAPPNPDARRGRELSGGDVDAAWEQVDAGEEAVGGSTPTPDQDVVDELGRAAGVTYEDTEPLRPEEKIAERDEHRWEEDPASAEDYQERQRELHRPAKRR